MSAFETQKPTRDTLINQITGGRTAIVAAQERFNSYVKSSCCDIIDDTKLVDVSTLFDSYFKGTPPFGAGKKKSEFPDALALNALESIAKARDIKILVVSKDGDWKAFCEASNRLYLVPDIERALNLVNNAAAKLRKTVVSWLGAKGEGHQEALSEIAHHVEQISYSADGCPTSGSMEAIAWNGELIDIKWPDEADVDIIEFTTVCDGNALDVVVSLPMTLSIKIPIELSFSAWDGIDRESISMGGRVIVVDEEVDARATITLQVLDLGTDKENVYFLESEIDIEYLDIELGDVEMFQPEDYWDGEE